MATHPEQASWGDLRTPPPSSFPRSHVRGRGPPLLLSWGLRDPSSCRGSRVRQALAQSRTPSPAVRTQRWETGGSCPRGPRIWRGELSTPSVECWSHRAREGSRGAGGGVCQGFLGRDTWGLCQEGGGPQGPRDHCPWGHGGAQGCAEKWGEAGAKSRDLGEEGVPWRKLGPSIPSPNQVPQIRARKAPLGCAAGDLRRGLRSEASV